MQSFCALSIGLGAGTLPAQPSDGMSMQTMKNLHATLNGERNAHARYFGFAQKADGEGYGAVASLFRAAAASDGVYGNSHEQTIWRLKGEPVVQFTYFTTTELNFNKCPSWFKPKDRSQGSELRIASWRLFREP